MENAFWNLVFLERRPFWPEWLFQNPMSRIDRLKSVCVSSSTIFIVFFVFLIEDAYIPRRASNQEIRSPLYVRMTKPLTIPALYIMSGVLLAGVAPSKQIEKCIHLIWL